MGILNQLTEKPWIQSNDGSLLKVIPSISRSPTEVGLLFFLASITALFTLLLISYNGRILLGNDWVPVPDPTILWINTTLLILSSIAIHRARNHARAIQIFGVRRNLLVAGLLTFGFLAGQTLASLQLFELGYHVSGNPANAFFYLLTGLHALHLIGGLFVWMRTQYRAQLGVDLSEVAPSIELCAIYWHYLLVVWIIIFALLLTT
jgi:cytochrome c oxidase subunit 3